MWLLDVSANEKSHDRDSSRTRQDDKIFLDYFVIRHVYIRRLESTSYLLSSVDIESVGEIVFLLDHFVSENYHAR